jgi:transcriptional regulator with XRE-family HTH domain
MKQEGLWTGKDLKIFRQHRELTQVEFGRKIGQTGNYVAMIETGIKPASRFYLQKIANAFKETLVIYIVPLKSISPKQN